MKTEFNHPLTNRELIAETLSPTQIGKSESDRMYQIMSKYYDSTSYLQFRRDLQSKHAVILLRDLTTLCIQGFSTLMKVNLKEGTKPAIGFFSGDTVIEQDYWGQRTLGVAFLKFLWLEKIKNPFRPVYWFLISKGYKTYLMMANNFTEHYPRFERELPHSIKKLMDDFYSTLYPGKYHSESGLIRFEKCEGKLKDGCANTTPDLIRTNKRIAFFETFNPGWKNGDELACIAKMTLFMPLSYQIKSILKKIQLKKVRSPSRLPEGQRNDSRKFTYE